MSKQSHRSPRVPHLGGAMRAGNGETEPAPPWRALGHRPGSRLRLEAEQTRSRYMGFCVLERAEWLVQDQNGTKCWRAWLKMLRF